jgi:hypothetical protein
VCRRVVVVVVVIKPNTGSFVLICTAVNNAQRTVFLLAVVPHRLIIHAPTRSSRRSCTLLLPTRLSSIAVNRPWTTAFRYYALFRVSNLRRGRKRTLYRIIISLHRWIAGGGVTKILLSQKQITLKQKQNRTERAPYGKYKKKNKKKNDRVYYLRRHSSFW